MAETIEKEKSPEYEAIFIGRLGDLGLGNENGIPSKLAEASEEELKAYGEMLVENLVDPTELRCFACIDGRHTACNHDGSDAEIRQRFAGGSQAFLGIAHNADSPLVAADAIDPAASLGDKIKALESVLSDGENGIDPAAHEGGCGAANGEVADHGIISQNPAPLAATKAVMEIPVVKADLGVSYDDDLGQRVKENAANTAEMLEASGWDGQAYVDGVAKRNPHGDEELEVDHDHPFHGHREDSVDIIVGSKTLAIDNAFPVNLEAVKRLAEKLAGERGAEGYAQAVIASIAKHMAVTTRLPGKSTPVYLLAPKAS